MSKMHSLEFKLFDLKSAVRMIFLVHTFNMFCINCDDNFLILNDNYHYCEGNSIIKATNNSVDFQSLKEQCTMSSDCGIVVVGPRWPELAAGWLCFGHEWENVEPRKGWKVLVKQSALRTPGFDLTVNTRGTKCSLLGAPIRGMFTVTSAATMCRKDAECISFSICYKRNEVDSGLPAPAFVIPFLVLCSDRPSITHEDGWITGVRSSESNKHKIAIDDQDGTLNLGPLPYLPSNQKFPSGFNGGQKGKYSQGIITQHEFFRPMPKAGVLFPTY